MLIRWDSHCSTAIAQLPSILSHCWIWSEWSLEVVKAHSLFPLQPTKWETGNQAKGKLIQSMMKKKKTGLTISRTALCCRAGSMMFPHFLHGTTGEYNLLAWEHGAPAKSCFPITSSDRYFKMKVKVWFLGNIYKSHYCECSQCRHSQICKPANLNAKTSQELFAPETRCNFPSFIYISS